MSLIESGSRRVMRASKSPSTGALAESSVAMRMLGLAIGDDQFDPMPGELSAHLFNGLGGKFEGGFPEGRAEGIQYGSTPRLYPRIAH